MNRLDESYFEHTAIQDAEPVRQKELNKFNNTMHENFFGAHINVTKLQNEATKKEKPLSKHKQKMGPINLQIENLNLMDAWEEASRNEVPDYKAG